MHCFKVIKGKLHVKMKTRLIQFFIYSET